MSIAVTDQSPNEAVVNQIIGGWTNQLFPECMKSIESVAAVIGTFPDSSEREHWWRAVRRETNEFSKQLRTSGNHSASARTDDYIGRLVTEFVENEQIGRQYRMAEFHFNTAVKLTVHVRNDNPGDADCLLQRAYENVSRAEELVSRIREHDRDSYALLARIQQQAARISFKKGGSTDDQLGHLEKELLYWMRAADYGYRLAPDEKTDLSYSQKAYWVLCQKSEQTPSKDVCKTYALLQRCSG